MVSENQLLRGKESTENTEITDITDGTEDTEGVGCGGSGGVGGADWEGTGGGVDEWMDMIWILGGRVPAVILRSEIR